MSHAEPDSTDPLAPARGCVNACGFTLVMFAIGGLALALVFAAVLP